MKPVTLKHISAALLVGILFVISFFKDHFTPDHLNSPPARFLSITELQGTSRFSTLFSHPAFWLTAVGYSCIFILVPFLVVRLLYEGRSATYIGAFLSGAILVMYLMILLQSSFLDHHIIPKLNRYLHSPIILLFIIAAFKLQSSKNE